MHPLAPAALAAALWLAALSAPLHAQTSSTDPAATAANDLVKRLDPTDFRTRIESRFEHQSNQDGGHRDLVVPRLDYAVSKTFSIRLETPFVRYGPGVGSGDPVSGVGDLLTRGAWRVHRSPGMAVVAGVETTFDTASDPGLGFGKHIASPFAFAAFDAPSLNSVIFPGVQHYGSYAGQDARSHVSFTQFRLFVLTRWPNRFYTGIENQLTVDHRRNGRVGFTIETEVGRFLDKHWAVWGRPGIGLLGDQLPYIYNWNFEVGFRYLFD